MKNGLTKKEMRQIKFRGKSTNNKDWVYGFYVYQNDGGWDFDSSQRRHFIFDGTNEKHYNSDVCAVFYAPKYFEVAPETVGQFTGLTDKNGKEIYDGDIVIGANGLTGGPSEVFYKYSVWQPFSYLSNYNGEQFEVIGNIHDDPELLK